MKARPTRSGRRFGTSTRPFVKNKQATPITVTFRVEIEDEDHSEEESETLTLRSINDCPFAIVDRRRRHRHQLHVRGLRE